MKSFILSTLLLCLFENEITSLKLPGPLVYVVTPSPRPLTIDNGRSAPRPFYYQNWMRRMDAPLNTTTSTTTTTTTPKVRTPDLIFAEFESDRTKNIRNLLEKERIGTSTTFKPIYVPDEIEEPQYYGLPSSTTERQETKTSAKDSTEYFALYNNMHNNEDSSLAPVYIPTSSTQKSTITETPDATNNVENIWHIIDSEKRDQYSSGWKEVPIDMKPDQDGKANAKPEYQHPQEDKDESDSDGMIDENFALPGFSTNPNKGAENESRAIRTEANNRYPYVNLKPFQIKNVKHQQMTSNKKGNTNMYTNLDNFYEIKNPVRGEAQDTVYMRQPVDRYNPAQPYLPSAYGSNSKQNKPGSSPGKTVANLVPPPLPPPPKVSENDFPSPVTYDSFPPYAPPAPVPPLPSSDTDDDSDSGPIDSLNSGYQYKPPAPPTQSFLPTAKPFAGYSYDKPITDDAPPPEADDDSNSEGYHYEKPLTDPKPVKPDFQGYHYTKPESAPPLDHPPSFDHGPPSHDSDYPELIFDKPHGGKGGKYPGIKDDDIGMMPPPPPAPDMMKPGMDGTPVDDSGFPQDFPGHFKYQHDFDDHDFYHHHHHHPTTTTTTTEMPRVNRYSYYFLGKKLYYLPLYFSVYFIIYVGALIIKAVLRHKIVYPNSFRPNTDTASFFSKRSVDSWDLSNEKLNELTTRVTRAIATAAERYMMNKDMKHE